MLFDFFPIILFFIAYKFFGIYVATAFAMATSLIQVAYFWFKHHRVEMMHILTLVIILILGGATLLLHDVMFIKWKPTVVYWIFTVIFLSTQLFSKKTLLESMMGSKIELPKPIWNKLNLSWAIFWALMGVANLYVVYNFSTNTWVNFKLFGTLGLTLIFVIGQSIYMAKYIKIDK